MMVPFTFIRTAIPLQRFPSVRQRSTCTRRRPHAPRAAGEQPSASNPEAGNENGALPAGSPSSKSTNKSDLGFVGSDRLGISFVCTSNDCNTRISKSIRRRSYEKGTVVIQCPTCGTHHVIADNTGMYSQLTGGKANIEEIAKAKGENVTRVDDTIFNLEDILANLSTDKKKTTDNRPDERDGAGADSDESTACAGGDSQGS